MTLDSQPKSESTKCPLTLKIPLNREVSSSGSSSLELSSILPTPSSSSSLSTLNVKFAPLPQLLPRKRRSTVPLGMAARGQLLLRRPGHRDRAQKVPPVWRDDEPDEYRMQREELAARDARCNAYAAYVAARKEDDDDEPGSMYSWHYQRRTKNGELVDEDPLQALGRIVKVAGKTLWKQVSNIDMAAASAAPATSVPKPRVDSKGQEESKTRLPTSTSPPPSLRPIHESIPSNVDDYHAEEEEEGLVWEEEIGDSFPFDISQTETIIEGRSVYSRPTSKVEVVSRSPPPSPTVSNLKRVLSKPHISKKVSPPFKGRRGS